MITSQDDFNLTDANFFATGDPYDLFRRLRAEDPVHLTKGKLRRSFWSVTKHEDALSVYRRASTDFGNCAGSSLPAGPEVEAAFTAADGSLKPPGAGLMMVASDGGLHQGLRKAFNRIFLPRAVARYEESGRKLVAKSSTRCCRAAECDFVSEVATQTADGDHLRNDEDPTPGLELMFDWANMAMGAEDPEYQVGARPRDPENVWLWQYLRLLPEAGMERRGGPGERPDGHYRQWRSQGRPLHRRGDRA